MEVPQASAAPGQVNAGFLTEFLSRFAKACSAASKPAVASAGGGSSNTNSAEEAGGDTAKAEAASLSREGKRVLVKIAGDVLFHCAVHLLQQVCAMRVDCVLFPGDAVTDCPTYVHTLCAVCSILSNCCLNRLFITVLYSTTSCT